MKNLTTLCKEEGITINHLAEILDYNRATIRERINNPQHFTIEELVIIAGLLKKTPTAIVKIVLRDLKNKEIIEEAEKVEFRTHGMIEATEKEQTYFESYPNTTPLTLQEVFIYNQRNRGRTDE